MIFYLKLLRTITKWKIVLNYPSLILCRDKQGKMQKKLMNVIMHLYRHLQLFTTRIFQTGLLTFLKRYIDVNFLVIIDLKQT